jgi:type II secretory pathway predicted ATPase ExeA
MYLEHFGLVEIPFRITPHTDFFFAGANRGATLEALMYAVTRDEGIVKVSGEVGSGKTMLCRVLMERLPAEVVIVYLANPSLSRDDILYAIADELGLTIPEHVRLHALLRMLQDHLIGLYGEGKQVVVLIDEAHAMPAETLEEIRLLSNLESNRHKLLHLVLFGQPELNDILGRTDMRQLKERITHNFSLEPLVRDDIAEYIDFRMRAAGYKGPTVFSAPAIKEITQASLGLTRRINILADKTLLAAYAQNTHQITPALVQAAIADSEFGAVRGGRSIVKPAGILLAVLAIGAGTYVWQTEQAKDPEIVPLAVNKPTPPPASTQAGPVAKPVEPPPALPPPPMPEAWKKLGPLSQQRLLDHRQWFEKAPDERWFVQILGTDVSQAARVEALLAKGESLLGIGQFRVYSVEMRGSQRIGLIFGDFATEAEAKAAVKQLPLPLRVNNPYPRQVKRLR